MPQILKRCPKEVAMREYEGYKWFGVETELAPEGILIPEFEGKKFPFYNGISGNEEWILKLTHFYNKKWKENKFCVHGDLALCNVIFGKEIHIIDWEHFHYNDIRFFGFDIVNMLYILLQYEYRWFTYWGFNWTAVLKEKHRSFLWDIISLLGDNMFLRMPFRNAGEYVKNYTNCMDKSKFRIGRENLDVLESLDWICRM